MALISVIENFKPMQDRRLLERAAALAPHLHEKTVKPVRAFCRRDGEQNPGDALEIPELSGRSWQKGETLLLDFGDHQVGRVILKLASAGSHPDAPAWLRLKFAENLRELSENTADYRGWVSSSWIQEEKIHVDVLPSEISLPRRYAFRYLEITVLDTSPKYRLIVKDAVCRSVTSAEDGNLPDYRPADPELQRIYRICLRTLRSCMQDVFEDGPKRDRRLWTGDLRLQALANYASYRNYDLVKRCLYLFAGSRFPDGRVAACLFTEPEPEADDTCLFDYMLFYPVILEEYLEAVSAEGAGDRGAEKAEESPAAETTEVLQDLYETAQQQIDLALEHVDGSGIVHGEELGTVFIDWAEEMNKDAAAQAVLIYAMRYALKLAERKGDRKRAGFLAGRTGELMEAARRTFWSEEDRCFVSGGEKTLATQTWMVLAGAASREEAEGIFERADEFSAEGPMTTPYMHHYYIMALLACGRREQALGHLRWYWGSMAETGTDTCWETWVPGDPGASPYGGAAVNSYCHAWSCTPAYLLPVFFPES